MRIIGQLTSFRTEEVNDIFISLEYLIHPLSRKITTDKYELHTFSKHQHSEAFIAFSLNVAFQYM